MDQKNEKPLFNGSCKLITDNDFGGYGRLLAPLEGVPGLYVPEQNIGRRHVYNNRGKDCVIGKRFQERSGPKKDKVKNIKQQLCTKDRPYMSHFRLSYYWHSVGFYTCSQPSSGVCVLIL